MNIQNIVSVLINVAMKNNFIIHMWNVITIISYFASSSFSDSQVTPGVAESPRKVPEDNSTSQKSKKRGIFPDPPTSGQMSFQK